MTGEIQYGRRSLRHGSYSGVRRVAPTFGKVQHLTYSSKSAGAVSVESDAERLVLHLLTLDPRTRSFEPQPFTVDLVDGRLLRTPEALCEARSKHKYIQGPCLFTPDFAVDWLDGPRSAIEVKLAGYEGDASYAQALRRAAEVLDAHGYRFSKVVWPAHREHPLRFNLPLLKAASQRADLRPDSALVQRVQDFCGDDTVSLAELCRELSLPPSHVPLLLVAGVLSADLFRQRLDGRMELRCAYGDLGHLALFDEVCV